MILKRINKLKDVGIFQDFEWPNPIAFQDFKKYNVIYGWNGTGKSTLSALLQVLGKENYTLPNRLRDSEFEVLFASDEDELTINQQSISETPSIRVFNEEFIRNYIKWEEIQADSIAYLGEKDTKRKKQLDNLKNRLQKLIAKHTEESEANDDLQSEIEKWMRFNAKIIKEALTTEGRSDEYANYNKSNIRHELNETYSNRDKDYSEFVKSGDELSRIKDAIHQTPKEVLPEPKLNLISLAELYQSLEGILEETVISSALAELKDKPSLERWVRNGLNIHRDNNLNTCHFCRNNISGDRMAELEGHFSDTYEDFIEKIEYLKNEISQATLETDFPQKLEVDKSLQESFKKKLEELESLVEEYQDLREEMLAELKRKEEQLYKPLSPSFELDTKLDPEIREKVGEINQIIVTHNQIVDNFESEILRKKEVWEKSHIAVNLNELIDLENNKSESDQYLTRISKLIEEHRNWIDQLKGDLSGDVRAANILSDYLTEYLGRSDLHVEYDEESKGFHFKRDDDKANNLSEGEKTGIALIYFLTKLGERDFDIDDCIVVIDDPVSSLDSNSLFYAFSFIKEHCKDAKQLILLTHNFEFLRRVNKWFWHESDSKYSRFMLKCAEESEGRSSEIDKIDPLLVNYESEYHYLFKLMYSQSESDEDELSTYYNYPNITRRYLEMFFSFRTPGETRMDKKIGESVSKGAISQEQGTALQHFLNVGSHSDSETAFTSFDVSHLAKSKDAINSALKLVENRDQDHYEAMVELVTR